MLLAALLLFASAPAQTLPTHWRLRVVHATEDGARPVAGALVRPFWELEAVGGPLAEVRTDERGEAAVELAPLAGFAAEERAWLFLGATVSAPGFRVAEAQEFLTYLEPQGEAQELELEPGRDVFGRVVDDEGRPVFDADVRLVWQRPEETIWHEEGSTRTDRAGVFALEGCEHDPEARHFVAASHGAYGAALVEFGEGELLVPLAPRVAPIRGVVVGPRGTPLPGKLVEAVARDDRQSAFDRSLAVLSDERGRFELHPPEEGRWELCADSTQPCESGPLELLAAPGDEALVVRACKPHALVRVQDASGRALRGVAPRLQRMRTTPAGPRPAYARARSRMMADGSSLFGELPGDGRYLVELHDPGLYGLEAGVRLDGFERSAELLLQVDPERDLVEARLVLGERPLAPPLALDVRDAENRPIQDWSATLRAPETGLVVAGFTPAGVPWTSTCGDMAPHEPHFPVGRYLLRVEPAGHALPIEQTIELRLPRAGGPSAPTQLASPGFGARLRVERAQTAAKLPRGLSLHLRRDADALASGPWQLFAERAGALDLWCPTEHESWPVPSLLLLPGAWTWELREGEAVRARGALELVVEQGAVLTLEL